eukprot:1229690-Prymnesium_polylepis.2
MVPRGQSLRVARGRAGWSACRRSRCPFWTRRAARAPAPRTARRRTRRTAPSRQPASSRNRGGAWRSAGARHSRARPAAGTRARTQPARRCRGGRRVGQKQVRRPVARVETAVRGATGGSPPQGRLWVPRRAI